MKILIFTLSGGTKKNWEFWWVYYLASKAAGESMCAVAEVAAAVASRDHLHWLTFSTNFCSVTQ
jgi:hypothetical protein